MKLYLVIKTFPSTTFPDESYTLKCNYSMHDILIIVQQDPVFIAMSGDDILENLASIRFGGSVYRKYWQVLNLATTDTDRIRIMQYCNIWRF